MIRLFFILTFFILHSAFAADFEKAVNDLEDELTETNKRLSDKRTVIFIEREKISREIASAKSELSKGQKSDTQLAFEIEKLLQEIAELELKVKTNKNSMIDLLQSSIQARRELETNTPKVNLTDSMEAFKKQDSFLQEKDLLNFFQSYESVQNSLLSKGFKLNISTEKAIADNGQIEDAQLISLGHSHSFIFMNGKGGIAENSKHHSYPSLKVLPDSEIQLKNIIDGKEGLLPFDFSNGLAFKKAAAEKTFSDRFKSGGIIMFPLTFLAVICIIVGIWKSVQLYIIRSSYDDKVQKLVLLIKEGNMEEAKAYIETLRGPVKALLKEALQHHSISRETLEELLNENILSQIPKLDRFMPVLSVSAGAAPLLGLLGTVMGIIKTFEMISLYGTGDPNTMAGGISEALVTTQAGLMVAIPALIWHAILNRRLKAIVGNLEKAMLSFINALSVNRESQ